MSICEELKALEEEMAFNFTQANWEDALIAGFRKDLSMASVLAIATGLKRQIIGSEWDVLMARAGSLKPSLNKYTSLKNPARVWIAKNAKAARDALWDGDFDKAKRLLKIGGKDSSHLAEARVSAKKEQAKDMRGKVYLNCREKDTRRAWNVCK